MKQLNMMMTLMMCFIGMSLLSQVKHEYSNLYENDTCKKEYLFSKSKMYIFESFKSANDVIQNEDIKYGIIAGKGNVESSGYIFSFTLKIKVKDGLSKIIIDEIYNTSTPITSGGQKYGTLSLDGYQGIWKNNITKIRYTEIMEDVNRKLNKVVDYYDDFITEDDGF